MKINGKKLNEIFEREEVLAAWESLTTMEEKVRFFNYCHPDAVMVLAETGLCFELPMFDGLGLQ